MSKRLHEELAWRGFANQSTFADPADVDEPRTVYWGVDPSADSMTIGNLAPAMMIRHFIEAGHNVILLVGGATGMIGDPDGKKQERDLKSLELIAHNKAAIVEQYKQVFAGHEFEVVDNYDWFSQVGYLDFLRDIGKHVSMTQLLDREFIQARIGEGGDGISYAEFSYSLIQGYDFLHLYRERGATLQVGGSDQWGNMISGVQLIRRIEGAESHVYSTPLVINKQTGVKFGKSEGGAVWLSPEKTSPYKFYQFWLNVDDDMAEDLIKIYTLLDEDTIASLITNHHNNPGERALQKSLAREVTQLIHGKERRESVERVTGVLFGGVDFVSLTDDDLDELAKEIPTIPTGHSVIEVLVEVGLVASNGEARRSIQANAVSINGQKISEDQQITEKSLLKVGKNKFILVK
jgi:tyrosyl-tRNA synthetase